MRISLKHFLFGAFITSVPMSFYAYVKLKPTTTPHNIVNQNPEMISHSEPASESSQLPKQISKYPIQNNLVQDGYFLTSSNNPIYLSTNEILKSLNITPAHTPTPTPPIKKEPKVSPKPETTQTTKTASYILHNQSIPENIALSIEKYSSEYGVNKDMMIHIARCESGFRENAVNGPYAGIYQFISSTWVSNRNAMGLNSDPNLRFNTEESVKTAAFKMSRDGFSAWPVCQSKAKKLLSSVFP